MPNYVSPLEGISQGMQQALGTLGQVANLYSTAQNIREQRELEPLRRQQAELGLESQKLGLETQKMQRGLTEMQLSQLLQPFDINAFKGHPLYTEENVKMFNDYTNRVKEWTKGTPYEQYWVTKEGQPTMLAWDSFKKQVMLDPKELDAILNSTIISKSNELNQLQQGLQNLDKEIEKARTTGDVDGMRKLDERKTGIVELINHLKGQIDHLGEQRKQIAPIRDILQMEGEKNKALWKIPVKLDEDKYGVVYGTQKGIQVKEIPGEPIDVLKTEKTLNAMAQRQREASEGQRWWVSKREIPLKPTLGKEYLGVLPASATVYTDKQGKQYIQTEKGDIVPLEGDLGEALWNTYHDTLIKLGYKAPSSSNQSKQSKSSAIQVKTDNYKATYNPK